MIWRLSSVFALIIHICLVLIITAQHQVHRMKFTYFFWWKSIEPILLFILFDDVCLMNSIQSGTFCEWFDLVNFVRFEVLDSDEGISRFLLAFVIILGCWLIYLSRVLMAAFQLISFGVSAVCSLSDLYALHRGYLVASESCFTFRKCKTSLFRMFWLTFHALLGLQFFIGISYWIRVLHFFLIPWFLLFDFGHLHLNTLFHLPLALIGCICIIDILIHGDSDLVLCILHSWNTWSHFGVCNGWLQFRRAFWFLLQIYWWKICSVMQIVERFWFFNFVAYSYSLPISYMVSEMFVACSAIVIAHDAIAWVLVQKNPFFVFLFLFWLSSW